MMPEELVFSSLRYPDDGSVLDGVTVAVGAADRVAVFGPNGAGKSTLLRMIAGTAPGMDRDRRVAYLPQSPHLFRGTGTTNLDLGSGDHYRALSIADALGVGPVLGSDISKLSGGERQRVALARALSGTEEVVALDEPMAPIDQRDRSLVAGVIREATSGRALLCVTHSIEVAAAVANELILMDHGRILQRGDLHDVLALPVDQRASELVGVSNVVAATVAAHTAGFAVVDVAGVPLVVMTDAAIGSEVVLRIPAESIAVHKEAPEGSSYRNVVEGTVDNMVPRGALVEVALLGDPGLVALVTPGAADALELAVGARVWFGVKTAAISVIVQR